MARTADQEAAYQAFLTFIADPEQQVLVIQGHAGTGKSYLLGDILADLPQNLRMAALLDPNFVSPANLYLTATTNKAAEALGEFIGHKIPTIYSLLKLRVEKDYETQTTRLVHVPPRGDNKHHILSSIIVIDEASYLDEQVLDYLFKLTVNCKFVFIGDPYQLAPVKKDFAPAFIKNYPTIKLEQVVRQGNTSQIKELAEAFRNTVRTGDFFSFAPNGHEVMHVDQPQFDQLIHTEFSRPDWKHNDSKILTWTNTGARKYGKLVNGFVNARTGIHKGDYMVTNRYMKTSSITLKTDEIVYISNIGKATLLEPVPGTNAQLNHWAWVFVPDDYNDVKAYVARMRAAKKFEEVRRVENSWFDLRPLYACTVYKAQGSTYDKVFIDLNDLAKCHNPNQLARLLYVAVSRARYQVIMTGDLV